MPTTIIKVKGGYKVVTPNHPEGHSRMPMTHNDAIAQKLIIDRAEGKLKKAKKADSRPGGMA